MFMQPLCIVATCNCFCHNICCSNLNSALMCSVRLQNHHEQCGYYYLFFVCVKLLHPCQRVALFLTTFSLYKFILHLISSGKDFIISTVTYPVPVMTTSFQFPAFFEVVDDEVNEIEQSFAVIARIEDTPPDVGCFKVVVGATDCFGRYGAIQVRISDNDGKKNRFYNGQ